MNNLILANLMRLKKSKIFWGIAAFMAMLGFFFAFMKKQVRDSGMDATLESGAFQYVALVGIVIAVFCAIFTGTEYADGTLRNKIIAAVGDLSVDVCGMQSYLDVFLPDSYGLLPWIGRGAFGRLWRGSLGDGDFCRLRSDVKRLLFRNFYAGCAFVPQQSSLCGSLHSFGAAAAFCRFLYKGVA